MDTDMYKHYKKDSMQRLVYRFVRMRQLKLIKRLDESRQVGETVGQDIVKKKGYDNVNETETKRIFAEKNEEESNEEEEEQEATFFDKLKSIRSYIFDHVFSPVIGTCLEIICKTVPLNSETGVNVLTLNSLHSILRREVGVLRSNGVLTLKPNEREFLINPHHHSQDKSHAYPIFSDISQ